MDFDVLERQGLARLNTFLKSMTAGPQVDDFLIESSNGLARFLNSASDEGEVHPCPEGLQACLLSAHEYSS
eukprot:3633194-Amphidinium_carterae.1